MKFKKYYHIIYIIIVSLFTGYVMLDTFVIPRSEVDASQVNMSMFGDEEASSSARPSREGSSSARPSGEGSSSASKEKPSRASKGSRSAPVPGFVGGRGSEPGGSSTSVVTHSGDYQDYKDDNISIKMSEYNENGTKIYVADVTISSAKYLKTAFANDQFGKNITASTSSIAESKNAIFAVNGDYSGATDEGYVIRNGVIYRDVGSKGTDILCIHTDGSFEITNSDEKSAEQLLSEGVWQAFSFGPALVENGEISVDQQAKVGREMASNPRTAVGMIDKNHYVFVVSDGRTDESEGLSVYELAQFMQKLGAKTAYNLDGGGSSTMYYNGEVINNPTTTGKSINERKVSDIVYIGY